MKRICYLLICGALIATLVIGVKTMTWPMQPAAIGFIGWAISPYLYLSFMIKTASAKASRIAVLIFSLLTVLFGIATIADAMFIHLDAQGGLVYLFVPLWQWAFLILATVPLYFLNRIKSASP